MEGGPGLAKSRSSALPSGEGRGGHGLGLVSVRSGVLAAFQRALCSKQRSRAEESLSVS